MVRCQIMFRHHGKLHQNGHCLDCTETVCCNGNHFSIQIVFNLVWKYAVIKASFSWVILVNHEFCYFHLTEENITALYLNLGECKLKTKLYTVGTVISYIYNSQSVLNASCTLVHIGFNAMVIVNFIWNYWIFLMSLLDVGSCDSGRLPRLQ